MSAWELKEAERSADAYYESIMEEWQRLTGRMVSPDDYRVMQGLRLDGVPLDVVQAVLREQVPKRGRSKPLAYHRPAILEEHRRRKELAAPAASWEGWEGDAPRSWEEERDELAGKVRSAVDIEAEGVPASIANRLRVLAGLSVELIERAEAEVMLWAGWAEWKRQALEHAAELGIGADVVERIIRRVEA